MSTLIDNAKLVDFEGHPEEVRELDIWMSNFSAPLKLSENFENIKKLALISNFYNHIEPISTIFQDLGNLTELTITRTENSGFKILKTDFFGRSKNLQTIDLHQNMIREIEAGVFNAQTKLKTVKLNMNRLISIPKGLFIKNLNLNLVDLKDNQLKFIPSQLFDSNNAVGTIEMDGNCCIDGIFFNVDIFEKALINCTETEQISATIYLSTNNQKYSATSNSMFNHYVFQSFFGKWSF